MNQLLRWSDLTDWQRSHVGNGCGPKGFPIPLPNFLFRASCNRHDFGYWRGGDDEDRKWVNAGFRRAMLEDANTRTGWRRIWYRFWAKTYAFAVDKFGKRFFTYRTKPVTMADLDEWIEIDAVLAKHGLGRE